MQAELPCGNKRENKSCKATAKWRNVDSGMRMPTLFSCVAWTSTSSNIKIHFLYILCSIHSVRVRSTLPIGFRFITLANSLTLEYHR